MMFEMRWLVLGVGCWWLRIIIKDSKKSAMDEGMGMDKGDGWKDG